jgi:hypothetical protein
MLYADVVWDGKAHVWVALASRLDDARGKVIFHAVVEEMGWSADDDDVEEGTGGCSTRAL